MIRTKHRSIASTLLLTSAVLSLAGCIDEGELALEEQQPEIVEELLRAGYQLSDIQMWDEDHALIQGDHLVDLSLARQMADAHDTEGFRGKAGSGAYYGPGVDKLCVEVGSSMWAEANVLRGVLASIADFNSVGLQMGFETYRRGDAAPAGCDAKLGIRYDLTQNSWTGAHANTIAIASSTAVGCTVFVNPNYINPGTDHKFTQFVMSHELGHCMGIRHEDWKDQSSCNGNGEAENNPADVWRDATDPDSIMFACGLTDTTKRLSNGDAATLQHVYPKLEHPAPRGAVTGGRQSIRVTSMAMGSST